MCDVGPSKIKGLSQLIVVQKFLFLFKQRFPSRFGKMLKKPYFEISCP